MCTNNLYDVIYSSWDIEWDRLKLVIISHFLPFTLPPKNPKSQNFEKTTKIAGDIIILHECIKNHNHMRYSSQDIDWDRQKVLSFWAIYCQSPPTPPHPPPPLTTQKIKILKQWKKNLEKSSLYICIPKITIIWCMLPEIWNTTDITFCHFGPFFALFPHFWPQK